MLLMWARISCWSSSLLPERPGMLPSWTVHMFWHIVCQIKMHKDCHGVFLQKWDVLSIIFNPSAITILNFGNFILR